MGFRENVFDGGNFFTLIDHDFTAAETGEVYGEQSGQGLGFGANYLALEAIFTYAADSATSAKAYVQTTLDGTTWFDIACFAFTTSTASKVSAICTNIAPASQAFTPGDAALSDNTIIQGVLGRALRVKFTSVGTYGAGSNITIHACSKRS
jgi:hypothetical protein